MRAVNLLPRDETPRSFEKKRGVVFAAGGGAALVTVGFMALVLGAGGAAREHQARIDSLNAELAAIPPPAPDTSANVAEDAALSAELSVRSTALSTALSGRVAWDGVLRQISQVLPDDVWLTALASNKAEPSETDPNADGSADVTLSGATYAQSGVARLLSRLSVAPALANVRLVSSTLAVSGSSKLVQFTIIATVKKAGDS